MDSRSVHNLLKVEGRTVTPRFWDVKIKRDAEGMPEGGTVSTFENRKQQTGTNYVPPHPLKDVPLKLRARYDTTAWPAENHPNPASLPPTSRNWGNTVWRRYPNGELDVRSAFQQLVEALRKYKDAPALNEFDALVLSSVLPDFDFEGLPRSVVDIKAYLTDRERNNLRGMLNESVAANVVRQIVDMGGA